MDCQHLRAPVTLAALICAACVSSPPPAPVPAAAAPAPPMQVAQSDPTCREFQQSITVGGQVQEGWGTTCLQPDGTWKIMRSAQPAAAPPPQVAAAPPPPAVVVPQYPAYGYYPYPYPYPYYYYPAYGFAGGVVVRGRWR